MDTIAVYWEPQIKTYGMTQKTGLHLVCIAMPQTETIRTLKKMRSHAGSAQALLMIASGTCTGHEFHTHIVFNFPTDQDHSPNPLYFLEDINGCHLIEIVPEVEMVYFHGPHFGDRYGIAHTVFTALLRCNVPLLASACSGASVYLVVPKGQSVAACQALSNEVMVPNTKSRTTDER